MSNEQPCLSKHSPCAASNKNVEDKSNSTTPRATCDTKEIDESSRRGSHCSSEKDSGYSDGSDWQQTDVEEQLSKKSQSRCSEHTETSQPGQNQELGQSIPGNPNLRSAGQAFQPIYIMNNMTLERPNMIQKSIQLYYKTGSRETSKSGAQHTMFLQQSRFLPATTQLHKPVSRNCYVTGKKINGTYVPTVTSYPRIAPHPSKKPPDKSSLNDDSQNLSKRMCTEDKIDDTPVTRSVPEKQLYKQPKVAVSASGQLGSSSTRDRHSASSSTISSSVNVSPSVHRERNTASVLTSRNRNRNSTINIRHRRFLNTVEILRQSGLLDITLRTKHLLRQSNATEQDIAQLRQHTELLCQAAGNPSRSLNGITPWEHLYRAMAESGSYPSLKLLQNLQVPAPLESAGQQESISTDDTNKPEAADNLDVPLSYPHPNIPDPNQNCLVPQQSHSGRNEEVSTEQQR
uniref:Uncharacterized LOC113125624 n=1 Tax=Mastacembelus armatus TaxID=205130 RepID=A0A3Q3L0M9_9TELE